MVAVGVVLYPFIGGFTYGWMRRHFRTDHEEPEQACPHAHSSEFGRYCECKTWAGLAALLWPAWWASVVAWLTISATCKALLTGPAIAASAIVRAGARIGAKPDA